jgi:hypothetical protein
MVYCIRGVYLHLREGQLMGVEKLAGEEPSGQRLFE